MIPAATMVSANGTWKKKIVTNAAAAVAIMTLFFRALLLIRKTA